MWNCYFESWANHKAIVHMVVINVVKGSNPKNTLLEESLIGVKTGLTSEFTYLRLLPKSLLLCFIPWPAIFSLSSDFFPALSLLKPFTYHTLSVIWVEQFGMPAIGNLGVGLSSPSSKTPLVPLNPPQHFLSCTVSGELLVLRYREGAN